MNVDNSYRTKERQCGNTQHLLAPDAVTGMKPSRLSHPQQCTGLQKPGQLSTLSFPRLFFPVPASQAMRRAACRPPFPISCFISREICFLLAVIGIQAPPDVGIRIFNAIFYAGENMHILPFQWHII